MYHADAPEVTARHRPTLETVRAGRASTKPSDPRRPVIAIAVALVASIPLAEVGDVDGN